MYGENISAAMLHEKEPWPEALEADINGEP
jgi:hypothetical protein